LENYGCAPKDQRYEGAVELEKLHYLQRCKGTLSALEREGLHDVVLSA